MNDGDNGDGLIVNPPPSSGGGGPKGRRGRAAEEVRQISDLKFSKIGDVAFPLPALPRMTGEEKSWDQPCLCWALSKAFFWSPDASFWCLALHSSYGMPYTISRALGSAISMPRAPASSRYQRDRQLRQKPAKFIRSMFCTSVRSCRCATRRRKAAASSSVRVLSSMGDSPWSGYRLSPREPQWLPQRRP